MTTFGLSLMWMAEFNAGFTAITWTDITGRLPIDSNSRQVAVRPGTGELFVSNGGGIFVLPAPGPRRSTAAGAPGTVAERPAVQR